MLFLLVEKEGGFAQDYPLLLVDSLIDLTSPQASSVHWLEGDVSCATELWADPIPLCWDVAIGPDGSLYSYGPVPGQEGQSLAIMYSLGPPFYTGYTDLIGSFYPDSIIQGLVFDTLGNLYGAGKGLTRYNNGVTDFLGFFPSGIECLGDICFREGNLYMSTTAHQLVEVDINNPANSTVVMDFPASVLPIHGLATVKVSCDSFVTYAIGKETMSSMLYEINFELLSLEQLCEIPQSVTGLASTSEALPAPCQVFIDLDEDDSSGEDGLDVYLGANCIAPVEYEEDPVCFSDLGTLDSLVVRLSTISDPGMEYLTFQPAPNIQIDNNGTAQVHLKNSGVAELLDFSQVFSTLIYHNDALQPTFGQRVISALAFSGTYQSDTAFALLELTNDQLSVEALLISPDCYGDENGSIELLLDGGLSPYQVEWASGFSGLQLSNLSAANYECLITDAQGCYLDTAFLLIQPDSLEIDIQNIGPDTVCGDIGALAAIVSGGTAPFAFSWNNNSWQDSLFSGLSPGMYQLEVTDVNACSGIAALELSADTVFSYLTDTLCAGVFFEYNGQQFLSDTSFCETYLSFLGCDSIRCVDLTFLDTVLVRLSDTICQGESILYNGVEFTTDTLIINVFPFPGGCDSTVVFNLEVVENTTLLTAEFCEGDSYVFNNLSLDEGGLYTDTLSSSSGCDSIVFLELLMNAAPEPIISSVGSFCKDTSVLLSTGSFVNYLWSTSNSVTSEAEVFEAGVYSVTVVDEQGCSGQASINIPEFEELSMVVQPTDPICYGDTNGSVEILEVEGGTPPYQYAIDSLQLQDTTIFEELAAGDYQIMVLDANQCWGVEGVSLSNPPFWSVEAGENQKIQLGMSVELIVSTDASEPFIQWSPSEVLACPSCLSTVAKPLRTTSFEVEVIDERGCMKTDQVKIIVEETLLVYAPNAFSPNGDGINDVFYLQGAVDAAIEDFLVFDRWGNIVFSSRDGFLNDPGGGWNGRIQNQSGHLNKGVYIWSATIRLPRGKRIYSKGDVMIVK